MASIFQKSIGGVREWFDKIVGDLTIESTTTTLPDGTIIPPGKIRANVVTHSDGAVGAPSVAFASDVTTGIYRSAASNLAIASAGVQVGYFRPKGLFLQSPTGPSLILRSGSLAEDNSQAPLVIARGSDGASCLTFIDSFGALNTNASIRLLGNLAQVGAVATDGTFTAASTIGNGLSTMLDVYSDTTIGIVVRTSTAGGAYALQVLDPAGLFVFSIKANGDLQWGAGSSHAAEDTTLTRSAAGVLNTPGQFKAASVRGSAVAFAGLPTPVEGMLVAVTDSNTVTWGATIAGGGANHVLAYYNGTNWTVAGK
jgi:hypothetical protein